MLTDKEIEVLFIFYFSKLKMRRKIL